VKIYVVGPCQTIAIAACLATMNPDVPVVRLPANAEPSAFEPGGVVLRQHDRAVMAPAPPGCEQIVYPGVWFNAFHPDVVFLTGPWGDIVPPLGSDHSSLALYGWHRGMSAAQTAKLFTEPVYEKLRFFDCMAEAKRGLLGATRELGFAFDDALVKFERYGCFMHTPLHPALVVMAEVARGLMQRLGTTPVVAAPELYLDDPLLRGPVWPVYPEIARRLGVPGSYAFKQVHAPGTLPSLLDLDEFLARSFEAYAVTPPDALMCRRLRNPAYRDLESIAAGERKGARNGAREHTQNGAVARVSPYAELPAAQFWRRAVERVPPSEIDPVGTPPFRIDRRMRIATAGSCFAQNMARVLAREGYAYFVAEPAPENMPPEQARAAGYGVFSARCGNVYTARQLLQLFERAFGLLVPRDEVWLRPDGRFADPFRPQIEPDGFASADDVRASRERHLTAVRAMFERLDVLIFTLGLTEAWRSVDDGAVFPLAPGVSAGTIDPARYEFVNFTAAQVKDDLDAFLRRLREVNPGARVVLTVSPQPPIATYEPRHVVVSSAFTKAALRVAADEIERAWPNVWYFPGYELVAGGYNRGAYFQDDLRTVTPQGVEHVMRLFLAHCADDAVAAPPGADGLVATETLADVDVVCDEEALAYGGAPAPASGRSGAAPRPEWADYQWSDDFDLELPMPEPPPAVTVTMGALDQASMRAPVEAALPSDMRARTVATIACTVRNDSHVALVSGGTHPVFLCYRWFDGAGNLTEIGRSIHTPLPGTLAPGAAVALPMRIEAPQYEGRYRLRVALLQSEVAWFDDVDPRNGIEAAVAVTARHVQAV